jgi:hypothetical protein
MNYAVPYLLNIYDVTKGSRINAGERSATGGLYNSSEFAYIVKREPVVI